MKVILNIHQLPDMQFVGQVNMIGKGLKEIMDYAEDRGKNYNQICTLADDKNPNGVYDSPLGIPLAGECDALKLGTSIHKAMDHAICRTHARRAGKMRCQGRKWLKAFMNRLAAIKNRYQKCLGGE